MAKTKAKAKATRRRPFVADTTGDKPVIEDEAEVLDEQQQEAVVRELAEQNRIANARWTQILKVFIICGMLVNVAALFIIIQASAASKDPFLFTGPPIPMAPGFALLSLILTGICYHITANPHPFGPLANISHDVLTLASVIAPAISFMMLKDRTQTFWWFSETALMGVCATAHSWIMESQGQNGPEGLEKLMYEHKGA